MAGIRLTPNSNVQTATVNYPSQATGSTPQLQVINSPGGSKGQVQFHSGNGSFSGDSNFIWNSQTRTMSILGNIRISENIIGKYNTNLTNLKITGGINGQVLTTDGNGNLTWANQAATSGNFGSNNVTAGNLIANTAVYTYHLSSTGTAYLTTLNVNAVATFSSVGNIVIPGGSAGQVLSTNGNGVLSWANTAATYSNSNVVAYGENGYAGNIIPNTSNTYSLGNATHQWNDLYVSNSTIYFNNVPLTLTGNTLSVNGQPVLSNDSDTSITTTGNIDAGTVIAPIASLGNLSLQYSTISLAQGVSETTIDISPNVEGFAYIQIPNDATSNSANLRIHNDAGNVEIGTNGGTKLWYFDNVGALNLTNEGVIRHTGAVNIVGTNYAQLQWTTITGESEPDPNGTNEAKNWVYVDIDGVWIETNINENANSTSHLWQFQNDGTISFPTLTVDLHNGGNQSARTLQFGNPGMQAVITGPTPEANVSADRLIIQGQRGNGTGEGGDVYVWAGDADTNGGDIKIYAGDADSGFSGYGGYINLDGGTGYDYGGGVTITGGGSPGGVGGTVVIAAGSGVTSGNVNIEGGQSGVYNGGNVNITAGYGNTDGGQVVITGGTSALGLSNYGNITIQSGASAWKFDNTGQLTFPDTTLMGAIEGANTFGFYNANNTDFLIEGPNNVTWSFNTGTGNTTVPGAINVGNMSIGWPLPGYITADANTGIILNTNGPDGGFVVDYLKEDGNANTSGGELAFSSETGNATYRISLSDDLGDGFATKIWRFDGTGNLTLPTNSFNVNYANGTQVSLGGGGNANTGNVTFDNQTVIGTGDEYGGGGLYLAPSTNSTGNLQYLRVRGGDYPTHIHLDTGNNNYFDQYFGADFRYVKLEANGNIVINADDDNGNSATWTFDTTGNFHLANGNSVIQSVSNNAGDGSGLSTLNLIPDNSTGDDRYLIIDPTGPSHLHLRAGGVQDASNVLLYLGGEQTYVQIDDGYHRVSINSYDIGNTTSYNWRFDYDGTLVAPGNIEATEVNLTGNIIANNIGNITSINLDGNVSNVLAGDGTWVTASAGGTNYGNSNVSTFLANYGSNTITTTGNISVGNIGVASITATANISTTGYFISGNQATGGFQLGNSNSRLKSGDSNSYMTMGQNPAIYPDTAASATAGVLIGGSGYILGPNGSRNITLNYGGTSGIVGLQSNVQVGTAGNGTVLVPGTITTGVNSILAGPTFTPLANTMAGFVSNVNSYTQLTIQNKSTGADATTDFVATADNGSDTVNYLDLGIINSGYDNQTPTNSLGNIVYAADSYLYAQGNVSNTSQPGGNLAIGTTIAGKSVKIFAGGANNNSVVATISNTGASITGNLTLSGNIIGSVPNVSLVAGSYTATFDNTGVLTLPTNGGDEGGEIRLGIPTSNTTLQTRVTVDVFQDKFRIFDGSTKGAYIDLSQAATGVGTLLNNRVSGLVNAGTYVTMDLIKATVTTTGNRGLSLAAVSGTFAYSIGGNFATTGGSGGAATTGTMTTTATSSIFNWGFSNTAETSTYILTDTTNNRCYRITLQIGASYNNNSIIIERLI